MFDFTANNLNIIFKDIIFRWLPYSEYGDIFRDTKGATVTFINCIFRETKNDGIASAPAPAMISDGILIFQNCQFYKLDYTASSAWAAVIQNDGGTVNFYNTEVYNIKVTSSIVSNYNGTVNIENSNFHDITTYNNGAIVYNHGQAATLNVINSKFNSIIGVNGLFYNEGTADLIESNFTNVVVSGLGGIIYNVGKLSANSCLFENNSAFQGGAIYNAANGILNITSSTFTNNIATDSVNGVIYNEGILTINNCKFNNQGTAIMNFIYNLNSNSKVLINNSVFNLALINSNGALITSLNGDVTIANLTFNQNTGSYTLIKNIENGNLNVDNVIFERNTGDNGYLIYNTNIATLTGNTFIANDNRNKKGLIYNTGNMNLVSDKFNSNSLTSGSIIYSSAGNLIISESEFNSNQVNDESMIYNEGSNVVLTNSKFTSNTASSGAVVYNPNCNTVTISYSNFTNNQALNGGVVYNNGSLLIDNSIFTLNSGTYNGGVVYDTNTLTIVNSVFDNNKVTDNSNGNGGVIYSKGTVSIKSSKLNSNQASNGGAIYSSMGQLIITDTIFNTNVANYITSKGGAIYSESTLTIQDSQFNSNTAVDGAAIFTAGISQITNTNFTLNTATNGAGIYTNNYVNLTSCIFDSNTATSGSGIYNPSSTVDIKNTIFKGNNNLNEGTIYNGGILNIFSSTFTSNSAVSGANIYNLNPTSKVNIYSSSFYSNTATNGGVIYNNGILIATNSTFTLNKVTISGGAIYNTENGNIQISLSNITNNVATDYRSSVGGAIYSEGIITIDDSKFESNSAYIEGGAIYNTAQLYIKNTNFTLNKVSKNDGGAIYNYIGTITIDDSLFLANTAGEYGGAIYTEEVISNLIIKNTVFNSNSADEIGGAIYNKNAPTEIIDSTFIENGADQGGALYIDKGNLQINNISFISNVATDGGAIYLKGANLEVTIEDSTFTNNRATGNGGAIASVGDNILIKNSTFAQNSAYQGGALYNKLTFKATLNAENCSFTKNSATYGGAIYNDHSTEAEIIISNSSLSYDNAKKDGQEILNYAILTLQDSNLKGTTTLIYNIEDLYLSNNNMDSGEVYDIYNEGTITSETTLIILNNDTYTYEIWDIVNIDAILLDDVGNVIAGNSISFVTDNTTLPSNYDAIGNYTNQYIYGTSGTYIISADVGGADNLNIQTATINVNKKIAYMNVTIPNINYGNPLTIDVEVLPEATGTIAILVNNKTYNLTVNNGKVDLEVFDLAVNSYTIDVTYSGDHNYSSEKQSILVHISQIQPILDFNVTGLNYGTPLVVDISLTRSTGEAINGTVTLSIAGKEYNVEIINGKGSQEIPYLSVGRYELNLTYNPTENYTGNSKGTNITVTAISPTITIEYGETKADHPLKGNITVEGVYGQTLSGVATVNINNEDYSIIINNGKGSFTTDNLPAGPYNLTVTLPGYGNYTTGVKTIGIDVGRESPTLTVEVSNIDFGTPLDVKINLTGVNGTKIDGNVFITIINQDTGNTDIVLDSVEIQNGYKEISFNNLAAGNHLILVSFAGNTNYIPTSSYKEIIISKGSPLLDIQFNDYTYGTPLIGTITLTGVNNAGINGTVLVTVDGIQREVAIVNGTGTVTIDNLAASNHDIITEFLGDENYTAKYSNKTVQINKASPDITVSVTNVDYGTPFTVNIIMKGVNGVNLNGNISIIIKNKDTGDIIKELSNVETVNGLYSIDISDDYDAGNYIILTNYNGNENYTASNKEGDFQIIKITPTLTVEFANTTVGNPIKGNVTLLGFNNIGLNATVKVSLDDDVISVNIKNGFGDFIGKNLESNSYKAIVTYEGSTNYNNITKYYDIDVNKNIPTFTVDVSGVDYGTPLNVSISLVGVNGIKLNGTGYIKIKKDGTIIEEKDFEIKNGSLLISFDDLAAGSYSLEIKYNGDENYSSVITDKSVNIGKIKPTLTFNATGFEFGGNLTGSIILKGYNDKGLTDSVTVTLTDNETNVLKSLTVKIQNGTGEYVFQNLDVGDYNLIVSFNENENYSSTSEINPIKINPVDPSLIVDVSGVDYGTPLNVAIYLNGVNGIPISDNITIYLNDTIIGKYETINGKYEFKLTDLAAGEYVIKVEFKGNKNYTDDYKVNIFNIVPVSSIIDISYGDVKANVPLNGSVLAYGINNSAINGKANITIKNKTYEIDIINGIGNFTTENLPAGSYDLTAVFYGNSNYTAAYKTYTIDVGKEKSTLIVNIPGIDYGQTLIGNLTLTGGSDSVNINGNVTVSISKNGEDLGLSQTIEVIDGNASFEFKNLASGNYIVTVTFKSNDKYMESISDKYVVVAKYNPSIIINVPNINYGDLLTGTVDVIGANNELLNINITVTIDGQTQKVEIKNGTGYYEFSNLNVGAYDILVTTPSEENYSSVTGSKQFEVYSINPTISVDISEISYGNPLNGTITITGANGANLSPNLTVSIGEKTVVVKIENGTGSFSISNLSAGSYDLNIHYNATNNYREYDYTQSVTINKATLTNGDINVTVTPINDTSALLEVTAPENVNGNVTGTINGTEYVVEVINGSGKKIIELEPGIYNLTVNYTGSDNYVPLTKNETFDLRKEASMNVKIENITYGEPLIVDVEISKTATGNITVIVDSQEKIVPIENGNAKLVLDNVTAGNHTIEVIYSGNEINKPQTINKNVTVSKFNLSDSDIEVNVTVNSDNKTAIVEVTLPTDATGQVNITINNVSYVVNLTDGNGKVEVNVGTGNYDVLVNYTGDNNYGPLNTTKSLEFRMNPEIQVNIPTINYGNNLTVTVLLPKNATGKINVTINNKNYSADIKDSLAIVEVPNLGVGEYTAEIYYSGDNNYKSESISQTTNVNKAIITPDDVKFNITIVDDIATINVTLPETATGNVVISLNGSSESIIPITNGTGSINIPLTPGIYNLTASYSGDDNLDGASKSEIVDLRTGSSVNVDISNITYGEPLIVNVTLIPGASGNVEVSVDGIVYSGVINPDGSIITTVYNLPAGNHTVEVKYLGDLTHNPENIIENITVSKAPVSVDDLKVNISTQDDGVHVDVSLPNNATGNVTIKINGTDYIIPISNGTGSIIINETPGIYNAEITYSGDDNYDKLSENITFDLRNDPSIEVDIPDIEYGKPLKINITGSSDLNGDVVVKVDGKEYPIILTNGSGELSIPGLNTGEYDIEINYDGDSTYKPISINKTVNISKTNINPDNVSVDVVFGTDANAVIQVNMPENITGVVSLEIEGKTYKINVINGTGVRIIPLTEGFYNISLSYGGDQNYNPFKQNMTLGKLNVQLTVNNLEMYYRNGSQLIVILTKNGSPLVSKTVGIQIIGKTYYLTTDNEGKARLSINLLPGTYGVVVTYEDISKTATVLVKNTIIGDNLEKLYKSSDNYVAQFLDGKGNPLKNMEVQFNIIGKIYYIRTNENGIAELPINLNPGTYVITGVNPVTGQQLSNNITVYTTLFGQDLVKYYKNGSQYQIKVLDSKGNPVQHTVIHFNIIGKFYEATTNENGIATLDINLLPGDYIITATNPSNGQMYSNNIKVLPIISGTDVTIKQGSSTSYNVKIVDNQGNPVANQKVTCNINGKFYTAISNANGIASFNLNLVPGEYIVTAMWNNAATSNKITVLS